MAYPVLGHQDSAHVTVSFEVDPEQVENFALHPVRRLPDALNRFDTLILARQFHFQHRTVAMLIREQMIDDFDPVLVIDSALIRKTVHRKLGILVHEASDPDDGAGINHRERIRLLVYCFENAIAEPILDPLEYLERFHAYAGPPVLPLPVLAARESQRSVIIFSCSLRRPSVSASGRGGQ